MDPISQGILGAAVAQTRSHRTRAIEAADPGTGASTGAGAVAGKQSRSVLWLAAVIGAFSGMAPDLDVLIASSTDPLLFLEFHRQFTHALAFIPIGALLCAVIAHYAVKRFSAVQLSFFSTYLFCLFGYATHALLDGCNSYGTQLFWPFSNERVAWNNVSVVDPLFTLPAIVLVVMGIRRNRQVFAFIAVAWMLGYLLLGVMQRDRALEFGTQLAASRGHTPARLEVKPSFANLVVWKLVYEHDGHYYIEGVRTGTQVTHIAGESAEKLNLATHLPWLASDSQQAKDIERFRWFSDDFLALDKYHPHGIVDVRYSMLPNEVRGLWGIGLTKAATADQHVDFYADRTLEPERRERFFHMLFTAD